MARKKPLKPSAPMTNSFDTASAQGAPSALQLRQLTQELEKRTAELREREEMVRGILATAADGIVVIDVDGTIQTFNQAAETMFGYRANEVVGRDVKILVPSMLHRQMEVALTRYLTSGNQGGGPRREVEGRRKDGSTFPMELAISDSKVGGRRVFTGILRDISESRTLQKEILEIAAGEQRRIGQDLHDGVGQELTGLGLLAGNLLEEIIKSCPEQTELSQKIVVGLKRVLGQVRALSQGLLPVEVDGEGLMNALQELAGRISDQAGVRCAFHCDTPVRVDDNAVATHLFRIAQEAVANALTHGKARTIDIGLVVSSGFLRLTVEDDGRGIRRPAKAGGLGLKIMQYRANLIGARFQVEPGEDGGTLVTCVLYRGEQTSEGS